MRALSERDGVSLWRQIGEMLIADIESGVLEAEKRLPSSMDLAARFGVNRHTVLRALSHLQAEGYVRVARGRGTYAVVNKLELRIAPRRWFEDNLLDSNRLPIRTVLSVADVPASARVAAALAIAPSDAVVFVRLLGEADGMPINLVDNHFPSARLPGIGEAFRAFGDAPRTDLTFSKIFAALGVGDFRRTSVRIRSRLPTQEEAWRLRMAQTEHVLETDVVTVAADDTPLVFANTCYCSSRAELTIAF